MQVVIADHLLSFDLFEVFGRALVQLERCFPSTIMLIRDGMNTDCDDQSVHALIIKFRRTEINRSFLFVVLHQPYVLMSTIRMKKKDSVLFSAIFNTICHFRLLLKLAVPCAL